MHSLRSKLTQLSQKGVMITHRNVIANTLQIKAFENSYRESKRRDTGKLYSEVALGLLPQSHIYALVVICHAGAYRGDQAIVLPKFELNSYLASIQRFKISSLFVVGIPIILQTSNGLLTTRRCLLLS